MIRRDAPRNEASLLAAGDGWRVLDVVCRAGPDDAVFEERHGRVSVTAVIGGSFVYRSALGRALMSPGALLLGNHEACFECGHEHGTGDRCISFQFSPDVFETIARDVPGARSTRFTTNRIPPLPALTKLFAAIDHGIRLASKLELEETGMRLAAAALSLGCESGKASDRHVSTSNEGRISQAVRRIERSYAEPLDLGRLAAEAKLSRYHFLRLFRAIAGATPYQYLRRTRFRAAARRLADSEDSIVEIAFACGFGDLSEFTRGFRRTFGIPPSAYRKRFGTNRLTARPRRA